MIYPLLVGGLSFLIAIVGGHYVVNILRTFKIGKEISQHGPTSHHEKEGTPTMGGLIIFGTVAIITIFTNIFAKTKYFWRENISNTNQFLKTEL